jgi:hypothetical protein
MRHKVAELENYPLNAAVALCEGDTLDSHGHIASRFGPFPNSHFIYQPSVDWSQGSPIIEREQITLHCQESTPPRMLPALWSAELPHAGRVYRGQGPTKLIAAMRAYVSSRYGDEIDLSPSSDELKCAANDVPTSLA